MIPTGAALLAELHECRRIGRAQRQADRERREAAQATQDQTDTQGDKP